MSDQTPQDDIGLPEFIRNGLAEAGIDLSNEEAARAATTTYTLLIARLLPRTVDASAKIEGRAQIEAQVQVIRAEAYRPEVLEGRWRSLSVFVSVIGAASLFAALVSGFRPFIDAIRSFVAPFGLHSIFSIVSMAYAQGTPAGVTQPQIAPVVVYGVYILFSVAYIVSLSAIWLGKETRDRANAMEVFKNLNSFFIGAISGKFV